MVGTNKFQDFGCNNKSPIDVWEMAGLVAVAISKDFGCSFESLGDAWEMARRWLEGYLLY